MLISELEEDWYLDSSEPNSLFPENQRTLYEYHTEYSPAQQNISSTTENEAAA